MLNIEKYQQLKEAGISPKHIYRALQEDGLDYIACIKTLRKLLDIPVKEAKDMIIHFNRANEEVFIVGKLEIANQKTQNQEQQENVHRIIQFLTAVATRPGMYIGNNVEALPHLLYGITTGALLCGTGSSISEEIRQRELRKITSERGWDSVAESVTSIMYRLGYPYNAIITETIIIEKELWKRLFEIHEPGNSKDL